MSLCVGKGRSNVPMFESLVLSCETDEVQSYGF